MRKAIIMAAIAAALLTVGFASAAGSPGLSTFGTADVFVNGDKFATFDDAGEYGGAYRRKSSNDPLSQVHVEFVNDRAVGGGAPRFSIPIDEDKDSVTDAYAFIDVNNCGSSTVSTDNPSCQVFLNTGGSYANWAALVAANPTWRLARKDLVGVKPNGKPEYDETMPFIVADVQGDYLVHGIVLGY